MRKRLLCGALLLMLACALYIPAAANAPAPPDFLHVDIRNVPDNAVYADLLIKIAEEDKNYTPINDTNAAEYAFAADAPIVAYAEEGFRSFTFHYRGARSNIWINKWQSYGFVDFCTSADMEVFRTQYEIPHFTFCTCQNAAHML